MGVLARSPSRHTRAFLLREMTTRKKLVNFFAWLFFSSHFCLNRSVNNWYFVKAQLSARGDIFLSQVEVISDCEYIEANYPCLGAVNRCAKGKHKSWFDQVQHVPLLANLLFTPHHCSDTSTQRSSDKALLRGGRPDHRDLVPGRKGGHLRHGRSGREGRGGDGGHAPRQGRRVGRGGLFRGQYVERCFLLLADGFCFAWRAFTEGEIHPLLLDRVHFLACSTFKVHLLRWLLSWALVGVAWQQIDDLVYIFFVDVKGGGRPLCCFVFSRMEFFVLFRTSVVKICSMY